MILKDGYNYSTIHYFFSQATGLHLVTGPISLWLALKQGKSRSGLELLTFAHPSYTP